MNTESAPAAASEIATGTAIAARGLTVRYFGREVDSLHVEEIEARAGRVLGVAGANGAGKSTLALALSGLIPRVIRAQVSGSIALEPPDAHVGIVFSSPHNQISATKATVREELAFGLENLGVPRADMDARIDEALAALRVDHLAERFPFELSGGEQQRVAIASIVVMGTDVLVLDEPTAQLDPASTRMVAELLGDLASRGTAVIVAEHAATVLATAHEVAVLDGGRVVVTAPPAHALGSPTLRPLGLQPPTVIELAEYAGIAGDTFPTDAALVEAFAALVTAPDRVPPVPSAGPKQDAVPVAWEPVRAQPPAAVEVRGLVHRYANGVEALRGVDLRIEPGEAVAILGQNGSGKTTLVKHLNGLLRPSAGDILIGGSSVAGRRVDELASVVGFAFQDPDDQLFGRSVARETRFGPRNLGLDTHVADRLVEQALTAAGLAGERDTNPYDLDRSLRKLVALASILAMDPAVLVLDEPTTGQDGPGVRRVGSIVDAYRAAGRTVIAITHDMEFAARHFPRLVVMTAGSVVADGPPSEVFAPGMEPVLTAAGLVAPPAARIGPALGLGATPTPEALLGAIGHGLGGLQGGDRPHVT